MSLDADKARRDEQFEVGEYMLLSTKFPSISTVPPVIIVVMSDFLGACKLT